MKKYLFGLTAIFAAMTISSCQREPIVRGDGQVEGVAVFSATIESGATKTALNKNGEYYDVLWRSGDAIAVVDNAANKGVYTTESVTSHADFTLRSGDAATTPDYKAWYPAGIYNNGTPTLPAVQTYMEGRSAAEGNICQAPMYAESGTSNLDFKNLCGIVKLNITTALATIKVRRIVLSADEGMSGAISNHASLATDGYAAAVSGTAGVTLDCGSACLPINGTPRAFHVAIPAGTYTNFSITVEAFNTYSASWCKQTKTFTVPVVVERSKITTIDASFDSYAAISPEPSGDPIDLSARETANTYIVSAAGNYKFKATVKGNGGFDPLTGTTATEISVSDISGVTVLWEQGQYPGYAIHQTAGNYDISYAAGYVTFTASSDVKSTACVAVFKDGAGGTAGKYDKEFDEILWSWLIWATPEPDTRIHNGKTFMDRNLGASTKLGGNYTRGFLFQWGRKDAFTACSGTDNYSVYYYTPLAENVFTEYPTEVKSMAYTIAHPTARIVCWTEATHSWMPEAEYGERPWREEVKTIYDPCPPGWKVPTKADMDGITGLPATGLYGSDNVSNNLRHFGNSDKGYYWTSTISTDPALPGNAWAFKTGENLNNWSQAEGYAIRPVRE